MAPAAVHWFTHPLALVVSPLGRDPAILAVIGRANPSWK